MIARWQAPFHKVKYKLLHAYRVLLREKKEVARAIQLQVRYLPGIDAVGIYNDLTLPSLAREFCQAYSGQRFAA